MTQRSTSGDQSWSQGQGTGFDTVDLGATGRTGMSGGQGAMDQARDAAGQAAEQAREATGQLTERAKEQATSQIATQKERAADGLDSVAQALRQAGQQLGEGEQGAVQEYVHRAAEQVERFSGYLHNKDVNGLVDDIERFARRQPALFVGSAFALGVLGARFLKSSRPQRSSARDYRYGTGMDYSRSRMYDTGAGFSGATRYGQGYESPGMSSAADGASTTGSYSGATGGTTSGSVPGAGSSTLGDTPTIDRPFDVRSAGGTEEL